MKDYQSAIEDCSDAIDLDSSLDYAYIYRGNAAYILTGKLEDQAQTDMDKAYSNSIAKANKILAQKPDDFDALVKRAASNLGIKSYAAAIQDYKKLIDLNPHYEQAYILLALYNSIMNGYSEAASASNIQTYTQGISANPESVAFYHLRGLTYSSKDDRSAVNDFSKAILNYTKKTKPTESEKRSAIFAISDGANAYYRLKDNTNALATINRCDEIFPDSVECLTYKGNFYGNSLKDYQKAVDAYNKAVNLSLLKKSSESNFNAIQRFYTLAMAYFALNDKGNAIAAIDKGLSTFPNDKYMWDYAANFYQYNIKDIGKATEYYNKAAQLGSESAKQSLGFIAEEKQSIAEQKQRKKARRNAAILAVMGAVNQSLETYNTSRQKPATSQIPQPNTPASPQSTRSGGTSNATTGSNGACTPNDGTTRSPGWSACALEAGEVGALFAGTIVGTSNSGPFDWNSCSQPDADNYKRCWSGWKESGISQVSFRLRGPFRGRNEPTRPYHWSVGFKNNTGGIVSFTPKLFFGDGTSADHTLIVLTPGAEYKWDNAGDGTSSDSEIASIQMPKWAFCPNAVQTTKDGQPAYKCVGK